MSEIDYLRLEVEGDPPAGKIRNLIENPNGDLGGYGWVTPDLDPDPGAGDAIIRRGVATNDLECVAGGGTTPIYATESAPCVPGEWVSVRYRLTQAETNAMIVPFLAFAKTPDGFGDHFSEIFQDYFLGVGVIHDAGDVGVDLFSDERTVPADAVSVRLGFLVADSVAVGGDPAAGDAMGLDHVGLVTQPTDDPVDWSDVVDEVDWIDVLGPTHDIEVDRGALQLGTLTATILDSTIDPATAETLATGRRCRLMALNAETAEWQPLITATIDRASVKYDTRLTATQPESPKVARITLSAFDALSPLSQQPRPNGVGTVDALRAVLEGARVPWVINGHTSQVAGDATVSRNESASAVDQVAITRDSRSAYAWMDRYGVLQVWDRDQMSPLTDPEFDAVGTPAPGTPDVWTGTGCTTDTDATAAYSGFGSLKVTSTGIPGGMTAVSEFLPVVPGFSYTLHARARAATTGRDVNLKIDWYVDDSLMSSSAGEAVADTDTGWIEVTIDAVAPVGATRMRVGVVVVSAAAAEVHFIDHLQGVDPAALVDEEAYSDIELTYDSAAFINSVVITFLRYDSVTGETTEIKYGPYQNTVSVRRRGEKRAEFTIHGVTEDAATFEAFAAAVLAANGTSVVTCESVEIPIREHGDVISDRALLDLYRRVQVRSSARGFDKTVRATGVRHRITPGKWLMTLTFAPMGSVAAPQLTPPIPPKNTGIPWTVPALTNGWDVAPAGFGEPVFRKVGDRTDIEGMAAGGTPDAQVFLLPEGYRPPFTRQFAVVQGDGTHTPLNVGADGVVIAPLCTDNASLSLNVSFRAEQ